MYDEETDTKKRAVSGLLLNPKIPARELPLAPQVFRRQTFQLHTREAVVKIITPYAHQSRKGVVVVPLTACIAEGSRSSFKHIGNSHANDPCPMQWMTVIGSIRVYARLANETVT